MEVGLSLGSNVGDRLAHLRGARDKIGTLAGVRIVAQAPVYETEPVGVQPEHRHISFLNTVLVLESALEPADLQEKLAAVEEQLGRVRTADKYAPRTLDIDVLYVDELKLHSPRLTLPHPRWMQRRFVLQPLADVRSGLKLPGADVPVKDLLAALPAGEAVTLFAGKW
ncbi:MAG TPA: 2-amino-4-hydroxy-6-hydroxymethyldihydropteridine diphosphokinase [Kiritimatiellia bacterium]|jgi:2-amino-4-hydroxy-6-hydroxymethyldihydropteridine diphosphokinase